MKKGADPAMAGRGVPIDAAGFISSLVSRGITLPAQPRVLLDFSKAVADGRHNLARIAQILAHDPGISAMLFKAARSPTFGGARDCETLQQAITVLGVQPTLNLVRAFALANSVAEELRPALDIFWTHSLEVAELAAIIAQERVAVCNVFPDQAYVAGLFCECGVPVLMQRFPDYAGRLNLDKAWNCPTAIEEDAHFDVDHCSIGYIVARHWDLPEFVCRSILYHRDTPADEIGAVCSLVAILQLSNHFHQRITNSSYPLWQEINSAVLAELGLGGDGEQEYFDEISERFLSRR